MSAPLPDYLVFGSPHFKPRYRGRIHQAAFWLSIPAGALLIVLASGAAGYVAASIYTAAFVAIIV